MTDEHPLDPRSAEASPAEPPTAEAGSPHGATSAGEPRSAAEAGSSERTDSPETASAEETAAGSAEPASEKKPDEKKSDENPWKQLAPWQGKAQTADKVLLGIIFGVPLIYMGLLPLRPWMLANAPVLQEFINGAKTSIVAAAAYARVGEIPLWLVVFAGFVGMAKIDWVFWLAGRRWGDGILRLFAQKERDRKRAEKFKAMPRWALFLLVLISRTPGIPGTLVWLVAGWARMKLATFLIADLLGVLIFTLIWTTLGYQLGEAAVDVLEVVDKYALWLTFGIIGAIFVYTFIKSWREEKAKAEARQREF